MNRNDSFSGYHPIVNLMYFICAIGYALAFTNPVCLGISFIVAFVYSVILRGTAWIYNEFEIYDSAYRADGTF
ncbi:MAG: hypothetical protein ACLVH0_05100 [Coprococcus eutactus]